MNHLWLYYIRRWIILTYSDKIKDMNRSFSASAIVLSLKPLGENNSSVTLLTSDRGIIYATLYGGPKSKMRSLVSTWNSGTIYLYENPEKNQIKISDFDVKNYHSTFSQNLYKSFAAALVAEIAIKTKCGGSYENCFTLVSGFFDGMELCNEDQSRVGLIRFLWRYLDLLGVQPNTVECSRCDTSFLTSSFDRVQFSYYNSIDNSFICSECAAPGENNFPLKNSAIKYLAATSVLPPSEVRKLCIDKEGYMQIRNILFFIFENLIEAKLNCIETGRGIL